VIPLRDENPSVRTPFVTWGLIAACVLMFFLQVSDKEGSITLKYGMVPVRISHPDKAIVVRGSEVVQTPFGMQEVAVERQLPPSPIPEWLTMISCIFLHGSLAHLLGNVWFLHIFGDNIEDRLGHIGYLVFYIGSGIAASLAQYLLMTESTIPTIGASGAIAGVMGAYLFLYPSARIVSLVPIAFFLQVMVIPAPVFLGIWFVIQLVQGSFSLGAMEAAGVAWWAHIGGFVAGIAVALFVGRTSKREAPRVVVIPERSRRPWD
jgi:membrane associated rhomboid family serine protease